MDMRQSRHTQHETKNPLSERFSLHSYVAGDDGPGSRAPILCISGFGCNSYNYEWMWPLLAQRGKVVLLENRGMGLSSRVDQSYELADLAADGVEVMRQLGFTRFHVVGISMGGMIAQLTAVNFPENVLSLSLLCTSSGGDRFVALPPLTPDMLRKAAEIPEPLRTDLTLRGVVHPLLIEQNPSLFAKMADLRRNNAAALDQLLLQKAAVDRFLTGSLAVETIACPTLVLSGSADRFVAPENARRLAALIPGAVLKFISDSDHYFFLEKAEEVATAINAFHRNLSEKSPEVQP